MPLPELAMPRSRRWWIVGLILALQALFIAIWGNPSDWLTFGLLAGLALLSYGLEVRLGSPWGLHVLLVGLAVFSAWVLHQPELMVTRLDIGLPTYTVCLGVVTYSLTYTLGLPGGLVGLVLTLLGVVGMPQPYVLAQLFLQPVFLFLGLGLYINNRSLDQTRRRLETAALTDSLTGLANRRSLEDIYLRYQALAERHGQTLVLTLWDLDGLKRVNDQQGHLAGDEYIRSFAHTLQAQVRPSDALFRISGDEFVGLHLSAQGDHLTARVLEHFARVSVGWTECTYEPLEPALAKADRRMYEHKQEKRRPTRPLSDRQTRGY